MMFQIEFIKRVGSRMGSNKDIYCDEPSARRTLRFGYSINKDGIGDLCKELGFNDNKLKLEIASGIRPQPGYIHLEYNVKKPQIHVKADARMIPFKDEVFDEVLCIHFLEHMYLGSIPIALSEMNRVLKTGGILNIEVPDFDVAKNRPINQTHLLYETLYMNNRGDGDIGNQDEFLIGFNHMSCFNYDILSTFLICSGFKVERNSDMERNSCHNWVGIVAIKATKLRKPHPSAYWREKLGNEIIQANVWNKMFVNMYG